jgi:peptide/nickel transport system substrate-binding protein
VAVYPYLPPPSPSHGLNTAMIIGCAAILLTCCCLSFISVYVVLADPFDWHLTARLFTTATPVVSATATKTSTYTPTSTRTRTLTPTLTSTLTRTATIPFTPTRTATRTAQPTPTYTDTTPPLNRITVCLASEPSTLFVYGESSYEKNAVLDTILDGPIDYRTYQYIPIILEELPTLENGSATLQEITVYRNGRYVDENDDIRGWGSSETKMEQLVVTFHLKEGLLWSDGTPLTADDSQFGYEIARDSAASASDYAYLAERTASYTALNSRTVQWVGLPGYTDLRYSTYFFPPVSRQAYGSLTPEQMINDQQVNTTPLGWGPFRIVEWNLGENIKLERNPFYFRAGEGLPNLDEVIFRFVPDDQIMAELATGGCDAGAQDFNWEGQIESLRASEAAGVIVPQYVKHGFFEHLDFNLQPVNRPFAFLADVSVRQAVAYCLDRQAIIDEVWYGLSGPPDSFIPPDHPLYNPEVTRYPFDPQRGLALLKADGWDDHDGDKFIDQNGRLLSLSLYTRNNLMRDRIAPLIARQLGDNCGIYVTIEFYTREELFSTFPDGLVTGRQFDLTEFYWSTTEGWQNCDLFVSAQIPSDENPSGVNYPGYANTEYDAACEAGMKSLNFTERLENYRQAQAIYTADLPSLPLFWRLKIAVARPFVSGLILDPSATSEFWNIEQVQVLP